MSPTDQDELIREVTLLAVDLLSEINGQTRTRARFQRVWLERVTMLMESSRGPLFARV